jgi:phosphoglycolate phosphatase
VSKRFKLLVFDWDGTIIDSTGLIVHSIQNACRDLGLAVPTDDDARYVIGLGLQPALSHLLPGVDQQTYPLVSQRYRYHYLARDHEAPLFGGVADLLQQLRLRGHTLAVATGKSRAGLQRSLQHVGLTQLFDATRCADETFSKPHPAMLQELMADLVVSPQETLMIGDTTHDLDMAANAAVAGLGVSYGAHPAEQLRARVALEVVDSVSTLTAWLYANA